MNAAHAAALRQIVLAQKRGEPAGIPSICSANPFVVEAAMRHAASNGRPVLIEATCNQVNQFGGYTGMTPADFVAFAMGIARACDFPPEQVILGGDHLGPGPWQDEPAEQAMDKACRLVHDCVLAGYTKIHLDASMACADDSSGQGLDKVVAARRAATLARVAEAARRQAGTGPLAYVIGTEVPLPGGAQEHEDAIRVTPPGDVAETIDITRHAFLEQGLVDAWPQVVAVVVQPGVEYGDSNLFQYNRQRARPLARFIETSDQLVYEAHSTDYQTAAALRQMVVDHFAILKVGPALTFALREGIFALAAMEQEWLGGRADVHLSGVCEALEAAMLADPRHWARYYLGDAHARQFARKYSFSDRSRYYWPMPAVQDALARLLANLSAAPLPLSLLSQYLPQQYRRIRDGQLEYSPRAMLLDKVEAVLADYGHACGYPAW